MNDITKEELSQALQEVRKAYRLLYFYQRRVLDTVKYITDSMEMKIEAGWSIFSDNSPKNGRSLNLDRWAWDWLNMYFYEFYCLERQIGKDAYRFAIQIQSDTGPYDSWVDARNVEAFGDVEKASTRMLFLIGKNRWKNDSQNSKDDQFFKIPALKSDGDIEFIDKNEDNSRIFVLKSYPLENFSNEETISKNIDDFKSFARSNGMEKIFN